MKTKAIARPYEGILREAPAAHQKPKRPNLFFRTLLKLVSLPDLWATSFSLDRVEMKEIGKNEPCLFLMNHSSFIDLEIVASILYPRPFNIVATTDGFIGKDWLMRQIGCIPTKKFTTDLNLVRDIQYATKELNDSVVLFPEAGYSLDGTATPLPDTVGAFAKRLGVPVVMIRTYGAFSRDPLYNNLQRRKVRVSATMECIATKEELIALSAEELQGRIEEQFTFDHFRWQKENGVRITEPTRADFLNRVLYQCPHCLSEGKTEGRGTTLTCHACGKAYELTELGELQAIAGETKFSYVTDWYRWEREEVRREIEEGRYSVVLPVEIYWSRDTKKLYRVGEGTLTHTPEGFHLTGCDGALDYSQTSLASYSVNSDFNFYEIGDMISVGNAQALYYCFPKIEGDIVAKMRLAAEESYKIAREKRNASRKRRDADNKEEE